MALPAVILTTSIFLYPNVCNQVLYSLQPLATQLFMLILYMCISTGGNLQIGDIYMYHVYCN